MSTLLLEKLFSPGGVHTVFQPVFDLSRGTPVPWGVECLARGPRGSRAEPAAVLFEYVRFRRREAEMDKVCLQTALGEVAPFRDDTVLSLNVHASTLVKNAGFAPWLLRQAREAGISPERMVLEIVEHCPAQDPAALSRSLAHLRAAGMRVALDDVGSGVCSLRLVAELAPDIVKIDKFFTGSAETNPRSRSVLQTLVELAGSVGAAVIAKGVESRAQLSMVFALGVRLVQGYGICEPLEIAELARRLPALFAPDLHAQTA
jgi:EAL domain-containing protein (putative c-di-GMP-specific phosphodiesterase class I)